MQNIMYIAHIANNFEGRTCYEIDCLGIFTTEEKAVKHIFHTLMSDEWKHTYIKKKQL